MPLSEMGDTAWAAAIAAAGAVLVAIVGKWQSRRGVAIPVSLSPELQDLATRFSDDLDEAKALANKLVGQVGEIARTVDTIGVVRERVSVVERGLIRIEQLLEESTHEMHQIKHKQNNVDMKLDALGRLILKPISERGGEA